MFSKMFMKISLALLLTLGVLLAACAAPAPTPVPAPAPAPAPKPSPTPLALVIEGAKKEGKVKFAGPASYPSVSIDRLEAEIKATFGIDIAIQFTGMEAMPPYLAKVEMETKAGTTPSYDLLDFAILNVADGMTKGLFEIVDWVPLLIKDTNPAAVLPSPLNAVTARTTCVVLSYNPEKISEQEVPKKFGDLAAPKFKGKLGIWNFPTKWGYWCWFLGGQKDNEKGKQLLKALIQNDPYQANPVDLRNRYLVGELPMLLTQRSQMDWILSKGVPVKMQILDDILEVEEFGLVIPKKAENFNAAKLLAVYIASPAGSKWSFESGKYGFYHSPGNVDYDIVTEAKKRGVPIYYGSDKKTIEWLMSPEYPALSKEVGDILKGVK